MDDEIYADQLHTLLQRISPELEMSSNMKAYVEPNKNKKQSDEEIIWDRIHGTFVDENKPKPPTRNQQLLKKLPLPRGGVFEPHVFRQSVVTRAVQQPDGSFVIHRTVRDAQGNEKTTVTKRLGDGRVETFNYSGNGQKDQQSLVEENNVSSLLSRHRNIFVTKEGYAIPKLW